MNSLLLGIITVCLFAITVCLIRLLIETRAAVKSLKDLIKTTESNLTPTITEIQVTLKSIRQLTDNLNTMSGDTKVFFNSLRNVGEDLQHLSKLFNELSTSTAIKITGIFSGVKNIIEVITKFCPPWGRKKEETNHG